MNTQEANKLFLTIDKDIPGNLTNCSLCGEKIKSDEDYFDYEYWGHAEIVHNECMNKATTNEKGADE